MKIPEDWEWATLGDNMGVGFKSKDSKHFIGTELSPFNVILISVYSRYRPGINLYREYIKIIDDSNHGKLVLHRLVIDENDAVMTILDGYVGVDIFKNDKEYSMSFNLSKQYEEEYETYLGMIQTFKFID